MEQLNAWIKAKIPCAETGIEIRKTICDICAPSQHCGIDAYVRDGKVIKVEGSSDHPYSKGKICTKGQCSREYIYRKNRIQTPLRRIGERGEGKFEAISWDAAYTEIAERLNQIKQEYSPHAVAFFSGYAKWYRPLFHRFVYDFGSVNFGTDDSVCNTSGVLACKCTAGQSFKPDIAHTNTFLGWAYNGYYSAHATVANVVALKERGGKVIIVDPKITPATKHLADIHLQLKTGTDGALALGMGKLIIENGWMDEEFIRKFTYGYEQYAAYVAGLNMDDICSITGLDRKLIYAATELYATNGPACINESCSTVAHHINGFQNYRAIACLNGLTGNFDRVGGAIPTEETYNLRTAGFQTREHTFSCVNKPDYPHIGEGKWPIWDRFQEEFQATDLCRQILEGTPYPIKAVFGLGMNLKMFIGSQNMRRALKQLDFFVDTDLVHNETTSYADIVLPACTSFERGEFKVYPGGYALMTKPVISPLYESKPDTQILCELSSYMGLQDELLESGYENCINWMIDGSGLTVDELKKHDTPIKAPAAKPYKIGTLLESGCNTPSGKFEFYSNVIAEIGKERGLNPITTYTSLFADDPDEREAENYPFVLTSGTRIPGAIHSRFHDVAWARSIRPEPMLDMNASDAGAMGIGRGDRVCLYSRYGQIELVANITGKVGKGNVHAFHGYSEADVNLLIGMEHVDPYSGFQAYKSCRCNVRKISG